MALCFHVIVNIHWLADIDERTVTSCLSNIDSPAAASNNLIGGAAGGVITGGAKSALSDCLAADAQSNVHKIRRLLLPAYVDGHVVISYAWQKRQKG